MRAITPDDLTEEVGEDKQRLITETVTVVSAQLKMLKRVGVDGWVFEDTKEKKFFKVLVTEIKEEDIQHGK
jgi:hypothetical protein